MINYFEEYPKLLNKTELELMDELVKLEESVGEEFSRKYMDYQVKLLRLQSMETIYPNSSSRPNQFLMVCQDYNELRQYVSKHTDEYNNCEKAQLIRDALWYMRTSNHKLPVKYELFRTNFDKLAEEVDNKHEGD